MLEVWSWPTPNGHKVHIALEELGLDYKIIPVNIGAGDQFKPEFLKITPNHRIPAIVYPDGPGGQPLTLFESAAIMLALADRHPQSGLNFPLGTHERFIGFLIEHYAGNFPFWLAPLQVRILPIGDEAPLLDYAHSILAELRAAGIRTAIDATTDKINGKVLRAEEQKVHTMLVLGRRDLEAGAVSVRVHGKGNLGPRPRAEVIQDLIAAMQTRRA